MGRFPMPGGGGGKEGVVPSLAKGGFYHAGQVCVSVQRVFADRAIAEDVARRLAAAAAQGLWLAHFSLGGGAGGLLPCLGVRVCNV